MCQFIMLTNLLRWIFEFSLLIEITYTFKLFKHDLVFYYKTRNNVFLKNPDNHSTSYGIYVAGETIYVDIPSRVAKIANMIDWKVINVNKDRLMFVYNSKPQILINQKTFKTMKYSGILSDSIIALGDNEALHVPTILNPSLTKPSRSWNYIELLYFDSKNEKVSVIRRLPWSKHDDWKFIKEWKMTDYIHFDNKLYLLIKRTIWNDKASNDTQEISIIRLCLEKGDELISSAIEIHFTRPELQTNQIIDLIYVFMPGYLFTETLHYQLHSVQRIIHDQSIRYYTYTIHDFVYLFDKTGQDCASGSNNVTSLRYHLRSEVTNHGNCSTERNAVPSSVVSSLVNMKRLSIFETPYLIVKLHFDSLPYPFSLSGLYLHRKPVSNSSYCNLHLVTETSPCIYIRELFNRLDEFTQADYYINKRPYGAFWVIKETSETLFVNFIDVCDYLKICTACIMYGLYSDCIWSNSVCKKADEPSNKITQTVDYCFKIINISPLVFDSMSLTTLTIELDSTLNLTAPHESLVIKAGSHNSCTNITINGSYIDCSLNLLQSGKFKIELNLMNDNYADTAIIKAISTDLVNISLPDIPMQNSEFTYGILIILIVLVLALIIIPFLLITGFKSPSIKHMNEFVELNRAKTIIKIATRKIKSKKGSRKINSDFLWSESSPKDVFLGPPRQTTK